MPMISVIVPVYGVEAYLSRCVDSILAQTFSDFQLILVDDGSPDRCPALCDEYARRDSRVLVIHQKNQGLSAARNAGIDHVFAHSDSQWLCFIDSDDWIHPRYLETLYHGATELGLPIASCSYQNLERVEDAISPEDFSIRAISPVEDYKSKNNDYDVDSYAWRFLYHRDLFREVRYPSGRYWEDLATTYKLLFQAKVVAHTDAPLYYYFFRSDSIASQRWSPRKLDMVEALMENLHYFADSPWPELYHRLIHCCQVTIARHMNRVETSSLPDEDKARYHARLELQLNEVNERAAESI